MRNPHQRIVDDDGVVVRGDTVGADQNRIADDLGRESHFATDDVVEDHVAVPGNPETHNRLLTIVDATASLDPRDVPAATDVLRWLPVFQCRLPIRLELLSGTE